MMRHATGVVAIVLDTITPPRKTCSLCTGWLNEGKKIGSLGNSTFYFIVFFFSFFLYVSYVSSRAHKVAG